MTKPNDADECSRACGCYPVLRTERFNIHRHEIKRDDRVGGICRTVFQAWFHSEDVPKPVCVVTINESFMGMDRQKVRNARRQLEGRNYSGFPRVFPRFASPWDACIQVERRRGFGWRHSQIDA